jgi:hypothetical protein
MHIPWYFLLFNKKMFNYYSRYNFFSSAIKKPMALKLAEYIKKYELL